MNPAELTTRRQQLGLTKAQLARELRVDWTTVHRWERDHRSIPRWVEAFLQHLVEETKQ